MSDILEAGDCSVPMKPPSDQRIRFSMSREAVAALLRELALRVETRDVLVQEITTEQCAKADDFLLDKLTVEYAQLRSSKKE